MSTYYLGHLIKCNLSPNRRPSSLAALKAIFDHHADSDFYSLSYEDDEDNDVIYSADTTKKYVDCYVGISKQAGAPFLGNYYGVFMQKAVNSALINGIPKRPPDGSDYGEVNIYKTQKEFLPFFAFITHVEHNSLDEQTGAQHHHIPYSSYYRIYYEVDWWTTSLLYGGPPDVFGDVFRAHVNEFKKDPTNADNVIPVLSNFTNETEVALPDNYVESRYAPIKSRTVTYQNEANEGNVAWLVFTLKNPSAIHERGSYDNLIPQPRLKTDVGTYVNATPLGLVFWASIGLSKGGSPQFRSTTGPRNLDDIVDDRFLSMYITKNPPADMTVSIQNELITTKVTSGITPAQIQYADGEYLEAYIFERYDGDIHLANFTEGTLGKQWAVYNGVENILNDSNGIDFADYLDRFVAKAHTYPYAYNTFYCSGTEIVVDTTIRPYARYQYVIDPPTGTITLLGYSQSAIASDVIYQASPKFIYTFYNRGVFAPYFSENWLTRLNSLDEAAHSEEMKLFNAVAAPIKATSTAITQAVYNPAKAAGTLASGAIDTAAAIMESTYQAKISEREINAYSEGYLQGGSVPTQAVAGLIGDNMLYVGYRGVRNRDSLLLNLHVYGYSTKLNAYEILKNHKRKYFNFIKTNGALIIPLEHNAYYTAEVMSHIQAMFDNGVWLLHDAAAEQTLLLNNMQEGL